MTNEKSGGLEAFMGYLDEYGQYRIHLECSATQEVFNIDCMKEVAIDRIGERKGTVEQPSRLRV